MTWVNTNKILLEPSNYMDDEIVLGPVYSLIISSKLERDNNIYDLFYGYNIIHKIYRNGTIFVLTRVNTLEEAKILHSRLIVKAMTTESKSNCFNIVNYEVTVLFDEEQNFYKFSQMIPFAK